MTDFRCGLILASASPRRRELLTSAGVRFIVMPAEIDEQPREEEAPLELTRRLAMEKAQVVAKANPDAVALGADTTVALFNGCDLAHVFGKPRDAGEAAEMLRELQGRTHLVYTAFAIVGISRGVSVLQLVETAVTFKELDDREIDAYVKTGEPLDKAGAYGAQGYAMSLIRSINGSYTNVVGLPLAEVLAELRKLELWSPEMLNAG